MLFIYGIMVGDKTQADAKKHPLRYEHHDDAARVASKIQGARDVCVDWCASAPAGTVTREDAAASVNPFSRAAPAES